MLPRATLAILGLAMLATGASAPPGKPGWRFHSAIENVRFTPSDGLVAIPRATDSAGYCDEWGVIRAKTAGGRLAEARGWRVTSEERLGPLTAVGIVRRFDAGTSATCWPEDGNVVIFEGARVVGVLYAEKNAEIRIGPVYRSWGGQLRLGGLSTLPPIGDLAVRGNEVRLERLAAERVCGGRATLPGIYGLSIFAARRKLRAAGWRPVPQPRGPEYFGEREDPGGFHARGVPEVKRCAGTGWGFCQFAYRGPAGTLMVQTSNGGKYGQPGVMAVEVGCKGR